MLLDWLKYKMKILTMLGEIISNNHRMIQTGTFYPILLICGPPLKTEVGCIFDDDSRQTLLSMKKKEEKRKEKLHGI